MSGSVRVSAGREVGVGFRLHEAPYPWKEQSLALPHFWGPRPTSLKPPPPPFARREGRRGRAQCTVERVVVGGVEGVASEGLGPGCLSVEKGPKEGEKGEVNLMSTLFLERDGGTHTNLVLF